MQKEFGFDYFHKKICSLKLKLLFCLNLFVERHCRLMSVWRLYLEIDKKQLVDNIVSVYNKKTLFVSSDNVYLCTRFILKWNDMKQIT